MLSATQTHLAKELSNDTASTMHDRGHAGEEFLTAYPKLLCATGLAVCMPICHGDRSAESARQDFDQR